MCWHFSELVRRAAGAVLKPLAVSVLRRSFDPVVQIVVAVVLVPLIEGVTRGDLEPLPRGVAVEVLDPADVDTQRAVTEILAALDPVRDPLTGAGLGTEENDRDTRASQLVVDPVHDGSVTFVLQAFEVDGVHEASGFIAIGHPAIANDHRSGSILEVETEKCFACHG